MEKRSVEIDLLITYLQGEANETEKTLVENRLIEDPDYFEESRRIQGTLNLFRATRVQDIPVPRAEQWSQFEANLRKRFSAFSEVKPILERLRTERHRIGFAPIAFASYIQGLAQGIGLPLSSVLEWFGIGDLAQPDRRNAQGFADLAQGIGLNLREALLQIRIGFAEQYGGSPILVHAARFRASDSQLSEFDTCEAALQQLERGYDQAVLRELESVQMEIRAFYQY